MPQFGPKELRHFSAQMGAYSTVTLREAQGDKSVTLDQAETQVVLQRYPAETIKRMGGGADDGKPAHRPFYLYDAGAGSRAEVDLALTYPKRLPKQELRLYFQAETGFTPPENANWFIFIREGENRPFVGYMGVDRWENLMSEDRCSKDYERNYGLDEDDDVYQKIVHSPKAQRGETETTVTRYPRDANLAAKVLDDAGYKCQKDATHETFIAASSNRPYVEAHHLVPMSQSGEFPVSLDVRANLFALCPNCHRAVHYGEGEIKRALLTSLYGEAEEALADSDIPVSLEDLLAMYGIGDDD
jgi:5-methylcytosine-specific restriction protein A